jgi:Prenyltransferase and squalene oxidase repeat
MTIRISRRDWLRSVVMTAGGLLAAGRIPAAPPADSLTDGVMDFIGRCARDDGGYAPSPDPDYRGNSDTGASDLAAVTYAAVIAKTVGRPLPGPEKSVAVVQGHQQEDGSFHNAAGSMKPTDDLALLYNTTQGVVCLRALGARPQRDPEPVMARFFADDVFKKLPWYTTSFFPLFYAALDKPFPKEYRQALADHMTANQKEDGYLGDHVASTFHMAHFFRLLGERTPRATEMVERVLHDQKEDGGWNIKAPDWDVHACFDAVFILRQFGGGSEKCKAAIAKGAEWALGCRTKDGGFSHYPGKHSDMDAVYFQFGTLVQAEQVPSARRDRPDAATLGWGHAMRP